MSQSNGLHGVQVRIHPKDPRVWEMLNIELDKDMIGEVVGVHEPPPHACDQRPRYCVKLDVDLYSLFYEDEIEVLP